MKRLSFIIGLLFLLGTQALHADVLAINQFSGLNTDDSPIDLQNGQSPDSENVVTDEGPGVQGRKGFVFFSTEPSQGLWEFPLSNGTRYVITHSSAYLKAATSNGDFTITISSVPHDLTVAGTPLGDRFYFSDSQNGLKYWNGTAGSAIVVASAALTVDKLVTWKGRLAGAGKGGAERTIYLSKYLDGTSWTAPNNPSDDDASIITVTGALDENIQALWSSHHDKLIWFKKNAFGGVSGSRRSNFIQRTYSDYVGVSSPETIRDCDGLLRWLGANRTVWEFDGAVYRKISEQTDEIFEDIAQGDSSGRSLTQTNQADFAAGTGDPTTFHDTSSSPGNLIPKTTTFLDTSQANFDAGTCAPSDSCDTTTTVGTLGPKLLTTVQTSASDWTSGTFSNSTLSDTVSNPGSFQTTFPDYFNSFRDGTGGTKLVWTKFADEEFSTSDASVSGGLLTLSGTEPTGFFSPHMGVRTEILPDFRQGTTFYFKLNSVDSDLQEVSLILSTAGVVANSPIDELLAFFSVTLSQNGSNMELSDVSSPTDGILFSCSGPCSNTTTLPADIYVFISTDSYQISAGSTRWEFGSHTWTGRPVHANLQIKGQNTFDATFDAFSIAPQTFTFTSATIDTGMTTPNYSSFSSSHIGPGTVTYTASVSADNVSYDAATAVTVGGNYSSATKRYTKAGVTISNRQTTGSTSGLNDFTIPVYSTANYTSRTFDTGFALPSYPIWGVLQRSTTTTGTGGTLNFFTQASADGSSWDARVAATPGTQITSAKKRYLRYQFDLLPTHATNYITIQDITNTAKSTGVFTSKQFEVGTEITAWGPVTIGDSAGNGSIAYEFSASAISGTFSTWNSITNGSVPTVSTQPYAAIRATFSLDNATDTPTVTDFTVSWIEGSSIRAASAYINQRYWLAVALDANANNRVLVFDKKRQWQRYSGMAIKATTLYNSLLYWGNDDGIYQAETGYSDNGTAISAYYTTPTLAPAGLDTNSKLNHLYTTTDNGDATLSTTFQINGVDTDYSLGSVAMNTSDGIQSIKFPFPVSEIQQGRLISVKWSVPSTSFWRILNGNLYFDRDAEPF